MSIDVRLDIERLVLDGLGLDQAGAARLGDAMQRELARLLRLRTPPSLMDGGAVPGVAPVAFGPVRPGERPERIGIRLARAVHGSLGA